jgi:hypothetical protein
MDKRFDAVEESLERIEKLILVDHKRRIERLEEPDEGPPGSSGGQVGRTRIASHARVCLMLVQARTRRG